MRDLLEKHFTLTPKNRQENLPVAFLVPDGITELLITMDYSPGSLDDPKACREPIERALDIYYEGFPEEKRKAWETYVPLHNLITLSLDQDGIYLGNAHRWQISQEHRISCDAASRGFYPPEKMAGQWTAMLHLHEIVTPSVEIKLCIKGVEE